MQRYGGIRIEFSRFQTGSAGIAYSEYVAGFNKPYTLIRIHVTNMIIYSGRIFYSPSIHLLLHNTNEAFDHKSIKVYVTYVMRSKKTNEKIISSLFLCVSTVFLVWSNAPLLVICNLILPSILHQHLSFQYHLKS
jgi:hypothetical protein